MDPARIELEKEYRPAAFESKWYAYWLEHDLFRAGRNPRAVPFTIVIPPPNITGKLHLGHALNNTLQDILVRWMRMKGRDALWLPGTDHAGIATQMVVERDLKSRGISRHDLGREKFLEDVWRWKEKHGSEILATLKRLGASCDWSRLRFTMDEGLSRAVREVFVSLYEDGLIYRGEDLINWCPSCRTALSELEVETEEGANGKLWEIAYPLAEPTGEIDRLVVATTRPETMLGDTAIAVHPEDARYRHLVGSEAVLPLLDRRIPIVGDAILVDPKFGTGVVKVTPAHDFSDFETGKRHALPLISIFDESGRINEKGGPYAGLDRYEARKRVIRDLTDRGLLLATKDHVLPLRRCTRCESVVEPFFSNQWFVKIAPLAAPALEVVENGRVSFVPVQWKKTYYEWMRNIHDWCISRQLWWGHRIPAWYCSGGHITVAREAPRACGECGASALRQEEDVLDTWFSSALWPFSTLGWPEDTADLRRYYPTSILSTGPDIIFFWVARMIMMGLRFRGEIPFQDVYFHGLVHDGKGEKMSKTRGNVIDPDDLIAEMGADPVRFTLAILASPGSDIPIARERMEGYRAFANKLWNASRFVLMNLVPGEGKPAIDSSALRTIDRWILEEFAGASHRVNRALAEYRFDIAAQQIYAFIWDEFCDWYIEWVKQDLLGGQAGSFLDHAAGAMRASSGTGPAVPEAAAARGHVVRAVLSEVLEGCLRLLHPFMPHVTEELWQKLPGHGLSIVIAPYPEPTENAELPSAAVREIEAVQRLIRTIRNTRAEMGVDHGRRIHLFAHTESPEGAALLALHSETIQRLARCQAIETVESFPSEGITTPVSVDSFRIAIQHQQTVADLGAELGRLTKEREKVEKDLGLHQRKLADEAFLSRAPATIVEKERGIEAELARRLDDLDRRLAGLRG